MARPLRILYPNAFYHVLNRGLEKRSIFNSERDFERFLYLLRELSGPHKFKIHSYCLMSNHYHLFIQTQNADLNRIMQKINAQYTQYFNAKYKRNGPLLQGRYKSILIDSENYALEITRYIHNNPVKASIVKNPIDYRWSSFSAFMGHVNTPSFLDCEWLLRMFSEKTPTAQNLLYQFTIKKDVDWEPSKYVVAKCILGSADFIESIKQGTLPKKKDDTIVGLREMLKPKNVEYLHEIVGKFTLEPKLQRKLMMYALKQHTHLTLKEIGGRIGGASVTAVGQSVRRFKSEMKTDVKMASIVKQVEEKMSNVRL